MNTFNFERFGKVVMYDLRKACQNYGYSFLILVMMPAIMCLMYFIMTKVMGAGFTLPGPWARVILLTFTMVALIVSFPAKVYGGLTDKRFGSDFLMLPASTGEKFVSMVLVTAVITPVLFFLGFLAVDALLVLLGLFDGGTLVSFISRSPMMENEYVTINLWNAGYFSLALNMLVFLLGAIYFRRGKTALTILCLFGIGLVFSLLLSIAVPLIFDGSWFENFLENGIEAWVERNIDHVGLYVNIVVNLVRFVEFAIVGSLIYVRLRTLKH